MVASHHGSVTWSRRIKRHGLLPLGSGAPIGDALELDLVEKFAKGRISRRQFIKRATVVGLSLAAIGAVIAACDRAPAASSRPPAPVERDPAPAQLAAPAPGGTIRVAVQRPVARSTPSRCRTSALRRHGAVIRVPVQPGSGDKDMAPVLADGMDPERRQQRLDVQAAPGVKWQDGKDVHVRRRRGHHGAARHSRQLRAQGRDRSGLARSRPTTNTVTFNFVSANGNFPYLVSVYNAQASITPADYVPGTTLDADRQVPGVEARSYDQRDGRHVLAQ